MKYSLKRIGIIFKYELKNRLKSVLIFATILFGILLLYLGLYESIKEMVVSKLDAMPKELLDLFKMGGLNEMTNYNSYFATIVQIFLILITVYSILQASSIIHDDIASGSIEYLNSHAVSRKELIIGKSLTLITMISIMMVVSFGASILSGYISTDQVKELAILSSILIIGLTPLFFGILTFLFGTILPNRIKPSIAGLSVFFATYLLGYLAGFDIDFLNFLKYLSPIDYLSASHVMSSKIGLGDTNYNFFPYIITICLTGGALALAYFRYHKKDL